MCSQSTHDKPKCYIAGPMTGYEDYNFPAFDDAKAEVEALGYIPVSPADMDRLHEGYDGYPPEDLVADNAFIRRCILRDVSALMNLQPGDAIYMLNGWGKSVGANAEIALAKWLGLTILYQTPVYVDGWGYVHEY